MVFSIDYEHPGVVKAWTTKPVKKGIVLFNFVLFKFLRFIHQAMRCSVSIMEESMTGTTVLMTRGL